MAINLNDLTSEQKIAIRSSLDLNEAVTRNGSENLLNKTLVNVAFSGECTGQLDLVNQAPLTEFSAVNRSTIRRELMMQESAIQRFNIARTRTYAGGAKTTGSNSLNPPTMQINAGLTNNANETITGRDEWTDTTDRAGISTNPSSIGLDHTSWVTKIFGTCYLNTASGGAVAWNTPFSISLRYNHAGTSEKVEYHAGICHLWSAGTPAGRGVGIFFDRDGYRLWSHDGSTYALTAEVGSNTLTYSGPPGAFPINSRIRFTSMPNGNNLVANRTYVIVENTGTTIKIADNFGGSPLVTNAKLEQVTNSAGQLVYNAFIAALPTYSSVLAFSTAVNFQTNQNILINVDGAGTASLYHSAAGNTIMGPTPIATIPVASTGSSIPTMALTCTCKGLNNEFLPGKTTLNNSHFAIVTASFAPFAV